MNKMLSPNQAWRSENEKAHGDNWRQWLGHLRGKPACGLEVGVWLGESAEWMLANIFTHPDARYIGVDTFQGSEEHHLAGIDCSGIYDSAKEKLARFGPRSQLIRAYSHQHGWTVPLDFVYIDAAHDAMNVLRDSVMHFEYLKIGGVMVWDDVLWEVMPHAVDRPRMAVESFISCYARKLEVIGLSYQAAIRKTSD